MTRNSPYSKKHLLSYLGYLYQARHFLGLGFSSLDLHGEL